MKREPYSTKKLMAFYRQVAKLTANHDQHWRKKVCGACDCAVVTAYELGLALEKVDPKWWESHP